MTFVYYCSKCKKTFERRNVPAALRDSQQCECGRVLKRVFTPTRNIYVPINMRAGSEHAPVTPTDDIQKRTWEERGAQPVASRWV
ncbi:MAG: hypothetical protein ABFD83_13845 [Armatimonadota bacterium]